MGKNLIETLMGTVVIAVAAIFMLFAYSKADVGAVSGYTVKAKFDRIDGINVGGDVRLSGIKVGTVIEEVLDPETFFAVVTLSIDDKIKLPMDTSAACTSSGLLGDKYLNLSPGADDQMIPEGGEIQSTQGCIDLFALLGQMIFSQTGKGEEKQDGGLK
jgi:phospholipid/cholesterol/gamma-HCH transport system substrate-binding protein